MLHLLAKDQGESTDNKGGFRKGAEGSMGGRFQVKIAVHP